MSYPAAQHDRMLAGLVIPCYVVGWIWSPAGCGFPMAVTGRARGCAGMPWQPARPATGGRRPWASRACW